MLGSFSLTAPAAVLGHLGAIILKILSKRKEVRKGADQANYIYKSQLKAFVQQHQSEASLQETA